jgi:hypothetical protein
MTRTFERFLRSFSDDELIAFARERSNVGAPYWKVMRLAIRIEADRRGLGHDKDLADAISSTASGPRARAGSA